MLRPLPDSSIYAGAELLPADAQGWHSDHEVFAHLIGQVQPKTIIEVGSWKGASALHMASLCSAKIYCVDTWLGSFEHDAHQEDPTSAITRDHGYPRLYHLFLSNVVRAGMQERIVPIPQTAVGGSRFLNAHRIRADLIYIDGDHLGFEPYRDITAYWGLLRNGGIMFGDDFGPQFPGVIASVFRFAVEAGFNTEILDNNFWVFRKP